ncbi:hypothetical protein IW140_002030 [Coemansia sp. RSA 1813]|nr:hypothetical protein EV178_000359 [Coemansia sp. RSA 1646]KAJ1773532.1 hypothetical protein LPJ74_000447 [Coemansia sp. RSA 1843]KAJ2090539.1 hypothetical protein IW138_002546 [Coemansia sp. RSA 986]KAJ2216373.1 hypothetical protein EV179_001399 [Coemansia sp. RSA 487]KAJ2570842.1 hypothetical protein IW140_002030 [Coemansia sp. RSA 1813]
MGTSKAKPTASKATNFLKRIHDTTTDEQTENDTKAQYYSAAGEDDHMGWEIGDDRIDPMYTVQRREREQSARGKDAFFKKLKTRAADPLGGTESTRMDEPSGSALGAMFGFGMEGMVPVSEQTSALEKPRRKHKSKGKKK